MLERFSLPVTEQLTLAGYRQAADSPRCAVCVVHGVGDHFPRYQELADQLGAAGCSVYGMDLPGHGDSPGPRGCIGDQAQADRCITALIRAAREQAPGLPLILFGHSMGGLLVLRYRHEHPDCPATAFAVCSPWLGLHFTFSAEELEEFRRKVAQDPYCTQYTDIHPNMLYTPDPARKSHRDPAMHAVIAYANILDRLDDIRVVFDAAGEPRRPLYILAGDADPICRVETTMHYAELEGDQCRLRIWPGLKHEPWNEAERKQVVAELLNWIDEQLGKRGIVPD